MQSAIIIIVVLVVMVVGVLVWVYKTKRDPNRENFVYQYPDIKVFDDPLDMASPYSNGGSVRDNVSYMQPFQGGWVDITEIPSSTLDKCYQSCSLSNKCVGSMFDPATSTCSLNSSPFLSILLPIQNSGDANSSKKIIQKNDKYSVYGKGPSEYTQTSASICTPTDLLDKHDIRNYRGITPQQCRVECNSYPTCKGFTLNSPRVNSNGELVADCILALYDNVVPYAKLQHNTFQSSCFVKK